jgi:hypothetical protein
VYIAHATPNAPPKPPRHRAGQRPLSQAHLSAPLPPVCCGVLRVCDSAADEGFSSFFDLTAIDIRGEPHAFEQYRGNVVLAVNVATD